MEDQSRLREELLKFLGIDEAVYLKIGESSIHARFEEGRSKEDKISGVQYIKFPFSEVQARAFKEGREKVELAIEHPNYRASAVLGEETRESLAQDLS